MEPPPPTWSECHAAGMSATEAAKARGLTVWAAYRWADRQARRWPDQRGSEENVQARMRSASIARARASASGKPATPRPPSPAKAVQQAIKTLPPDVYAWLKSQTPPGIRLDETVAAILIDAYYEETDA